MLKSDNVEDLKSIEKCREITQEILRFGVNDLEIKKIIDILSLELEDTDTMRKIQSILKGNVNVEEKPEFTL